MTFAERIAEFAASESAAAMARIRRQAEERARRNGFEGDEVATAVAEAERRWYPGCSHEEIVAEVAGSYRRAA